jgi:hypothetical protein
MEMYYQDNTFTYAAADADALISATDGVTVTVDSGDASAWTATAVHASTDIECTYDSDVGTIACDAPVAP